MSEPSKVEKRTIDSIHVQLKHTVPLLMRLHQTIVNANMFSTSKAASAQAYVCIDLTLSTISIKSGAQKTKSHTN
jgi:hypothetical protein